MNILTHKSCPHCAVGLDFFQGGNGKKAGIEINAFSESQIRQKYYCECPKCNSVFFLRTTVPKYEDQYFIEEYKSQYGRSYFEDKPQIQKFNKKRLQFLSRTTTGNDYRKWKVLEVGCAAGYFLESCHELGFEDLSGMEISSFMIKNAVLKNRINYIHSDFLSHDFKADQKFDLICSFFVFEHFPQQADVFAKAAELLNPGGYLFLSLPSTYGPAFQQNLSKWFETHPVDHFADYSPQSLEKMLPSYGLQVKGLRVPTFHPERVRGTFQFLSFLGPLGQGLYQAYCQFTHFGDTIEVIAQKSES